MYFLNPGAFWAFTLILIPILIHLFNLRRVKKIYFSNLKFLKDVSQQRKSRTTLKKLLVLLARILAIAFIVLAFSQPVLTSEETSTPVTSPIIYLDNSLSLQRTDESGNLLLINGISSISGLLDRMPKGVGVGFVSNDRRVIKWEPLKEVSERIMETDYSNRSVLLESVFEKANRLEGEHFYVFSDFQKTTSSGLETILQDTSTTFKLYKLRSPTEKNLYVDSIYLNEPLSISSDSKLNIVLGNTSSDPVTDVLVKLFKEETQLASFTVNIGANTTYSLSLDLSSNTAVTGDYRIELEDSPVVFDNTFYFSINASKRPQVVILSDGSTNPYLGSVFANSQYFNLVKEEVSNASFQNIVNADLLILDHLREVPPWLLSQLPQLRGKVLVCPPDGGLSLTSYKSLLGFSLAGVDDSDQVGLSVKSLEHPFFNDFFIEKDERMDLPKVRVDYHISGYYESILTTNSGVPYLIKNGNVHFFTGSFKKDNTTFPKHAIFVPVMYKLAQHTDQDRLYYRMGEESISMRSDSISAERLLRLENNQNSYMLSTRFIDEGMMLNIPDVLDESGIYYLTVAGDTLRSVAINYEKAESEIADFSIDELRKIASGYDHVSIREISDVQEFVNAGSKEDDQESLWKYALFLALFFIISELVLLRFI